MKDVVADSAIQIAPISGVRWNSIASGIKKNGELDLALMEIEAGASVAAVFTQNAFSAAPVHIARENLRTRDSLLAAKHSAAKLYLLINSGNANAGTGAAGHQAGLDCCERVAEVADCAKHDLLPFSTGVNQQIQLSS